MCIRDRLYTNLMLFGDAYLEAVTLDGVVREITHCDQIA